MGRALALQKRLQRIKTPALHAAVAVDGAVQLQHLFTARRLMQSVDILGNDRLALAPAFQLRQRQMGGVGLRVRVEHHPAVEIPKFVGVSDKIFMRKHLLIAAAAGGIVNALMGAAKIRDAAGGGDPRAAEKDDVSCLRDPLAQDFRFLGHSASPLSDETI